MNLIFFQVTVRTKKESSQSVEQKKKPTNPDSSKEHKESTSIPIQGLLHAVLAKCLRPNVAIFVFICINFVFNTSDSGSDLALGFFLKDR